MFITIRVPNIPVAGVHYHTVAGAEYASWQVPNRLLGRTGAEYASWQAKVYSAPALPRSLFGPFFFLAKSLFGTCHLFGTSCRLSVNSPELHFGLQEH